MPQAPCKNSPVSPESAKSIEYWSNGWIANWDSCSTPETEQEFGVVLNGVRYAEPEQLQEIVGVHSEVGGRVC